jgi:hypothetical protein
MCDRRGFQFFVNKIKQWVDIGKLSQGVFCSFFFRFSLYIGKGMDYRAFVASALIIFFPLY